MHNLLLPTIFALSSGPPPAGIAVIRISGSGARLAIDRLCPQLEGQLPPARQSRLQELIDPTTKEKLDEAIIIWFPGPASFTGEDICEIHCHGGAAIISRLFDQLGKIEGFTPASAGEFSRRAFLNGHLDLTEIEGIADLINAETEGQHRQAIRHMSGEIGRCLEQWRADLVRARALIEAGLDFSDEEDTPHALDAPFWRSLHQLHEKMAKLLDDSEGMERLKDGLEIVLLGPTNSGKSSLINALTQRDVAIVTAQSGTTRDLIEVRLDLGGYPATIIDTAGLRDSTDAIEKEGIRRAVKRAETADLLLWLQPADDPQSSDIAWKTYRGMANLDMVPSITALSKSDLTGAKAIFGEKGGAKRQNFSKIKQGDPIPLSVLCAGGLDLLQGALKDFAARAFAPAASGAIMIRARQREALREACHLLENLLAEKTAPMELTAEQLRQAGHALGAITGHIAADELLDVIFSEFCIGK